MLDENIDKTLSALPLVVVTGASGTLGQRLVPLLINRGTHVVVAGRDTRKLQFIFPGQEACRYDDLAAAARDADALIHLAVLNNDVSATLAEFQRVNVDLTLSLARAAKDAGIKKFINISSTHALSEKQKSLYARTKREAGEALSRIDGINLVQLYLPAVVGDRLTGKLALLDRLPRFARGHALAALSALEPTVTVHTLADTIYDAITTDSVEDSVISETQSENVFFRVFKRMIDLCFAFCVVVLFWWLLLISAALIRLQSPGAALFIQERVGRDGKVFRCFKFRTMRIGTPNVGTHDAPREAITQLGHFLRKTKIDELPQVINIFRNEISLVGPRPCLPVQTELVEARRRRGILAMKPGITGLAQVNGIDMSDPEQLARCDERYLKLQSLLLDIKIILATALGRGGGDRTGKT